MIDQKKSYISPKGVLVYPHLNTPDMYKNQSNYKATLRIQPGDAEKLLEELDDMLQEHVRESEADIANALPLHEELDKDGAPTGFFLLKTKMKSSYTDKKTRRVVEMRPKMVDAKLQRIPSSIPIGGGSEGRVNFTLYPYVKTEKIKEDGKYTEVKVAGISFRLQGVQITKLVERSAGDMGFEEDPEGYTMEFGEDEGGADY